MRISDIRVRATMVFCCLGALALGCSESSKTSLDAAMDASLSLDTAQDLATHQGPDGSADAIAAEVSLDVAAPDAAHQADGVPGRETGGDGSDDSAVPTTMASIIFRFKNTAASTLYLHQACSIFVRVTSLADGKTYGNGYACACDCSSPTCNGGMACGACPPDSGVPIEVGSTKDIYWVARFSTEQLKTGPHGPFQCQIHSPIPTGPYKVEILVYQSASDATSETNSRKVEKTFALGTADATIEVSLQ